MFVRATRVVRHRTSSLTRLIDDQFPVRAAYHTTTGHVCLTNLVELHDIVCFVEFPVILRLDVMVVNLHNLHPQIEQRGVVHWLHIGMAILWWSLILSMVRSIQQFLQFLNFVGVSSCVPTSQEIMRLGVLTSILPSTTIRLAQFWYAFMITMLVVYQLLSGSKELWS